MTTVYFATNRSATQSGGFGSGIVAPAETCYAVIQVADIDLGHENSGNLGAITMRQAGGFTELVRLIYDESYVAAARRGAGADASAYSDIKAAPVGTDCVAAGSFCAIAIKQSVGNFQT